MVAGPRHQYVFSFQEVPDAPQPSECLDDVFGRSLERLPVATQVAGSSPVSGLSLHSLCGSLGAPAWGTNLESNNPPEFQRELMSAKYRLTGRPRHIIPPNFEGVMPSSFRKIRATRRDVPIGGAALVTSLGLPVTTLVAKPTTASVVASHSLPIAFAKFGARGEGRSTF